MSSTDDSLPRPGRCLLLVVEGTNDIAFLSRLSWMLHQHDPRLPDLNEQVESGRLVVLPAHGDDLHAWTHRLTPLGMPEMFLLDRECGLQADERRKLVASINERPNCIARLPRKRSLENYLHADAIQEAGGPAVEIDDICDVPRRVAECLLLQRMGPAWEMLTRRQCTRMRYRIKKWLNRKAASFMTPERLKARDPRGEVRGWLSTIAAILDRL